MAASETAVLLDEGLQELKKYQAWIRGFDTTLRSAQKDSQGLPSGYLWQDEFVDFWKPFDAIQREVVDLLDRLEEENPEVWKVAHPLLDPPRQAQIEFAIAKPKFVQLPGEPYSRIAYPEAQLKAWARNFSGWVSKALSGLRALSSKS